MMSHDARDPMSANGIQHAAGGYGPPGGGGYGGPPPGGGGASGGGGGYGGPPPGGGGYGGPPGGGAPPAADSVGLRAAASAALPGFGPAGGFPPPGGPMMPGAGGDVNTTLPLILNIVGALFCGGTCVGFILAIVGIVFAVQAGNAKNAGDIVTAQAQGEDLDADVHHHRDPRRARRHRLRDHRRDQSLGPGTRLVRDPDRVGVALRDRSEVDAVDERVNGEVREQRAPIAEPARPPASAA